MDIYLGFLLLCIFLSSTTLIFPLIAQKCHRQKGLRPPGPPGWPIIGNIFDVGTLPHQTFCELRPKYGSVLWLKLGCVNTLVIQSAKAATEFFKNHDHVFCDRKCADVLTALNYNQGSMTIGRYGPHWKFLRRLTTTKIMTNRRVDETAGVRKKCIDNMIQYMDEDAAASRARGEPGELELSPFLFVMAFNLIGNIVLSRDLVDPKSKEGREFFDVMGKLLETSIEPNVADFFPVFQWLDPQGIKRNAERELRIAMEIIARYVKERLEEKKLGKENETKDFLDDLLDCRAEGIQGADRLTDHNVIIFLVEMFFAGSDGTSISIEWAMVELLRHPETMRRVKDELDQVVGLNRRVEESDIEDLPYLKAVVKESLRLHPPIPLTLPRNAMESTNFMGYDIPKDTQVWVNVWAIGRDPDAWEDPLSFKPERFLGSKIDYKGKNYELIPFGSGRRMCAGLLQAQKVFHLGLASLLHCFDWELPGNITTENMNMDEKSGLTLRKLVPLKAIPKKHSI